MFACPEPLTTWPLSSLPWTPTIRLMALPPEGTLWVCFPKLGKLDTDLGRDKLWGWMKEKGFQGEKVINIDDIWSAFSFRR